MQMKKEQREIADNLVITREEKKEKQATICSLQDRVNIMLNKVQIACFNCRSKDCRE